MIKEMADQLQLLRRFHSRMDKFLEDLTDEQWVKKPHESMNNIASIIEHAAKVERKFVAIAAGEQVNVDTQAPFKAESWNVSAIKADWVDVLHYSETALQKITEEGLEEPALQLGGEEVNKRQLVSFAIAHLNYHVGQLPLLRKMI